MKRQDEYCVTTYTGKKYGCRLPLAYPGFGKPTVFRVSDGAVLATFEHVDEWKDGCDLAYRMAITLEAGS